MTRRTSPSESEALRLLYIVHVPSSELPRSCGPWFALRGYPAPPTEPDDGNHY